MPLDAQAPATKTDALTATFAEIGRPRGAAASRKPTKDVLAWEYAVSSLLARLSDARRDKAKKAAIAGGVLPDYAANPLPIGTADTVYVSPLVTIGLKVVAQAERVNVPNLVADLLAAGVKPAVLTKLIKKNTESFAGAHVFTASLTG